MEYALPTTIEGPVDCTASQIIASVLDAPVNPNWPQRTRYTDAELVQYAKSWIHWTDAFGFRTAGQVGRANHETNHLRYTGDVPFGSHNFAGLGATGGVTGRGYDSIDAGVLAVCAHQAAYTWGDVTNWPEHLRQYVNASGRHRNVLDAGHGGTVKTWGDFTNGRWAHTLSLPVGTLDNGYARACVAKANRVLAQPGGQPMPTPKPRIALAAGHHNTSGGNATEHANTGKLTPAVAAALRERGFEVRVITPDEGRGEYPGGLADVAAQVTADDDVFFEIHTEGNNAGDRGRGVFVIYPDWGNDVDTDVRDTLGPALAQAVRDRTGIPLRGNGTMSEQQTGVGGQGHRLGVFSVTARHKATCTRFIIEVGAHTSPADMAIWGRPTFISDASAAIADTLATWFGLKPAPQPPPPADGWPNLPPGSTVPDPRKDNPKGKFWMPKQFAVYMAGLPLEVTGWVIEPARGWINKDGELLVIQHTERQRYELHRDGSLTLGLLGSEAVERGE